MKRVTQWFLSYPSRSEGSGSQGSTIAVGVAEIVLDTAKDVLEFCSIPGAVLAVGSVLKIITLVKVRDFLLHEVENF